MRENNVDDTEHRIETIATPYRFEIFALAVGLLFLGACASSSSSSSSLPSLPSLPSASSAPSLPSASPPGLPSAPSAAQPSMPSMKDGQGEGEGAAGAESGAQTPAADAKTADERRASVDRELDASLAEMDRLLLREKEMLARQRADSMNASGSGSFGGAGGGTSGGNSAGGEFSGAQAGDRSDGEQSDGDSGDASGASPSAPVGSYKVAGSESSKSEEKDSRVPTDIPDGRDDDIVARQLREAAVSEDDPELREKLWEEYRKYKSGQS